MKLAAVYCFGSTKSLGRTSEVSFSQPRCSFGYMHPFLLLLLKIPTIVHNPIHTTCPPLGHVSQAYSALVCS